MCVVSLDDVKVIKTFETAKEAWEYLERIYEGITIYENSRILTTFTYYHKEDKDQDPTHKALVVHTTLKDDPDEMYVESMDSKNTTLNGAKDSRDKIGLGHKLENVVLHVLFIMTQKTKRYVTCFYCNKIGHFGHEWKLRTLHFENKNIENHSKGAKKKKNNFRVKSHLEKRKKENYFGSVNFSKKHNAPPQHTHHP